MGFPRQEYWSGLPFPPPGDLPDPGIKPSTLTSPALAGRFFTTEPPEEPWFEWGPPQTWGANSSLSLEEQLPTRGWETRHLIRSEFLFHWGVGGGLNGARETKPGFLFSPILSHEGMKTFDCFSLPVIPHTHPKVRIAQVCCLRRNWSHTSCLPNETGVVGVSWGDGRRSQDPHPTCREAAGR